MEAFRKKEEQKNDVNDLMDIIMLNLIEEEKENVAEQYQQQQQQQQHQQQENAYEGIIHQETQDMCDYSDMFTEENNMTQICYDLYM